MSVPAITIYADEPLHRVEEKMRVNGIRHLPVLDRRERVVGVITQRDLYRTLSPRPTEDGAIYVPELLDEFILEKVMTPDPTVLGPEDAIGDAIRIMAYQRYGCIPVVDGEKRVLGIVTQPDVLKYVASLLDARGGLL